MNGDRDVYNNSYDNISSYSNNGWPNEIYILINELENSEMAGVLYNSLYHNGHSL